MRSKLKNFYFGDSLSPEQFLARWFLSGIVVAVIVGTILVVLEIR